MGFPIMVRWHLYIELRPWCPFQYKAGIILCMRPAIANALELLQSCIKSSVWCVYCLMCILPELSRSCKQYHGRLDHLITSADCPELLFYKFLLSWPNSKPLLSNFTQMWYVHYNHRVWSQFPKSIRWHGLVYSLRPTDAYMCKLAIIDSDNGLFPGRCQAIIWTNAGMLLIGSWGPNFSQLLIKMYTFPFKKMHLKMSSVKWQPFCLILNVLINTLTNWDGVQERQPIKMNTPPARVSNINYRHPEIGLEQSLFWDQ